MHGVNGSSRGRYSFGGGGGGGCIAGNSVCSPASCCGGVLDCRRSSPSAPGLHQRPASSSHVVGVEQGPGVIRYRSTAIAAECGMDSNPGIPRTANGGAVRLENGTIANGTSVASNGVASGNRKTSLSSLNGGDRTHHQHSVINGGSISGCKSSTVNGEASKQSTVNVSSHPANRQSSTGNVVASSTSTSGIRPSSCQQNGDRAPSTMSNGTHADVVVGSPDQTGRYPPPGPSFHLHHVHHRSGQCSRSPNGSRNGGCCGVQAEGGLDDLVDHPFFTMIGDGKSLEDALQIVSSKGTVRGVRNRVKAGIAAFVDKREGVQRKDYRTLEKGKVVLYTTSVMVVRETYEKCLRIKKILQTHMVRYEERDVSLSRDNQRELIERLGVSDLPQVFAEGLHIGGADDVERLNENGTLRRIFQHFQTAPSSACCVKCGGYRYTPCSNCHGSKKSWRNNFTTEFCALRCTVCDDNGLVMCDLCSEQEVSSAL